MFYSKTHLDQTFHKKRVKRLLTAVCDVGQVGGQAAPAFRLASCITFHYLKKSAHIVLGSVVFFDISAGKMLHGALSILALQKVLCLTSIKKPRAASPLGSARA